jgi:sphingolipid delta-4 desaturase
MLIHECSHNLVFKKTTFNFLASVFANLPMALPCSISFKRYHMKHHAFQGVYELDADIASDWEAKLVGNSSLRKALWLLFFPIFQATRPARLKEIKPVDRWIVFDALAVFSFDVALYILFGPKAFIYLLLSLFFAMGLHPLGARWIQEHYIVHPPQETYSYYGPLNLVTFNIGYHNEHHDFPSVPWNRIRRIREVAPEWYNTLFYHKSLTRLLFQFVFDPNISLHSRVVRRERGGEPLRPEFTPDLEILSSGN